MLLHSSVFNSEFVDFLVIGWDHIIDMKAYDHLLFIMVLCAAFTYKDWKKILAVITAFTIGHSLTLALSALDYVFIKESTVEILIPITIFATAIANNFRFFLGEDSSIVAQLFAFNSGLELGQIVVVLFFMAILWFFTRFFNLAHRDWALFISGAGAGVSLIMILDNF